MSSMSAEDIAKASEQARALETHTSVQALKRRASTR
jgi:hypothetical protein